MTDTLLTELIFYAKTANIALGSISAFLMVILFKLCLDKR